MKKVLSFIKRNILLWLLYVLLFIIFRRIMGASPAILLIVFFAVYGLSMAINEYGHIVLSAYERANKLTPKNLLKFSLFILIPTYLFWILLSVIPIFQFEVWLITGLPIVLLSSLYVYGFYDYWKHMLKKSFLGLQLLIYVCCFVIGQVVSGIFFNV